ncbi:hypothetical protein N0V90_012319 [Kalmusia sp. IMI 367209]|nr:hypothetical protein N0V90_012319 [Kalmusia sp. IMI 367209]
MSSTYIPKIDEMGENAPPSQRSYVRVDQLSKWMRSSTAKSATQISTLEHDYKPENGCEKHNLMSVGTWNENTDLEVVKAVDNDKIAIVGMSVRLPESASQSRLWQMLEECATYGKVPSDRFNVNYTSNDNVRHDSSKGAECKGITPYGQRTICQVPTCQPFFKVSPEEEEADIHPALQRTLKDCYVYDIPEPPGCILHTRRSRLERLHPYTRAAITSCSFLAGAASAFWESWSFEPEQGRSTAF